jgi:2-oxoglutarate ferredoxin oxidoreductase subunit delta
MAGFLVVFDGDVCKGCQLCEAHCPKRLIELGAEINNKGYYPASITRRDECVGCASCALVCPDGAISIYKEEEAR